MEPRTTIDDIDLAAAIASAMHASSNHSDVSIEVSDGFVTLHGHVLTVEERDAALEIARGFAAVAGVASAIVVG